MHTHHAAPGNIHVQLTLIEADPEWVKVELAKLTVAQLQLAQLFCTASV